jgi:glycosyltransferase involved in cell wall biosynthesis
MKLSFFAHEYIPQVGHSRAMIELVNGLTPDQKDQVTLIEVVSCQTQNLDVLFPQFKCKKSIILIPGGNLKPFLLKMFVYHLFTYIYSLAFCRDKIKIGIGIASLNVNISNIQFIHEQWKIPFFAKRKLNIVAYIYKKILFWYFEICEIILFKNKNTHFIVIANFLKNFIQHRFGTQFEQFSLIPSGVNIDEFSIPLESQTETISLLIKNYPALQKINFNKPVPLFIGAFERKGLDRVLDYLSKINDSQLILIGKPESFSHWIFPSNINIAYIPFTKEINLFYAVSDIFIFPTYYEPFGLVILEAYAMGLDLIIPFDNVGASEILKADDGLYFFKQNENLPLVTFKKLTSDERLIRRENRINNLKLYTWENSAKKFYSILSKY